MSRHTTRLTQSRTRTTPGSYEAPVEGIVDYGAFQRGFASSFYVPEQEEEEIPDLISLEDIDYAGTASKSGGLGLTGEASQQMNDSLDAELRNLQAQLDSAVVRKDVAAQRKVMKNYNLIKKTVAGAQFGFNHIANSEGAFDAQQAADLKLGVKADGTRMSFYEISQLKNQTKDSNFGFVFDYEKGTGGVTANGFTFGTNNMNADTVSKLTPLKSNLSQSVADYDKINEVKLVQKTDIELDPDKKRTIKSYTRASVDALNQSAVNFGEKFKEANPDTYQASFLDAVLGDHRLRAQDPTRVSFADGFGSKGFKLNPDDEKEKGYTTDDFIAHIQKIPGREIPGDIVDAFMRRRGEEKYKNIVGSPIYKENKFGFAEERGAITSTAERDPKEKGGLDIDIGGGNFTDRDLLQRVQQLLNRTGNRQEQTQSIKAFAEGQVLRIPEAKENIKVSKDMIRVDYGERGVGGIGPAPENFLMNEQPIIRIDVPLEAGGTKTFPYDLSKKEDIEKLMKALYGTTSQTGTDWTLVYEPTIEYVQKQRAQEAQRQTLQQRKPLP
tara:strand:- start:1680 stop:3341 length:1662 start_codon:yes stop_codon:yes gene_type:complete